MLVQAPDGGSMLDRLFEMRGALGDAAQLGQRQAEVGCDDWHGDRRLVADTAPGRRSSARAASGRCPRRRSAPPIPRSATTRLYG